MRCRALLAALLFAALSAVRASAAPPPEPQRTRVIVMLRETEQGASGAALERRRTRIAEAQERVLERVAPEGLELHARWRAVPGFAASVTPAALRRLQNDPDVLRVDPDSGGSGTLAESVQIIGGNTVRANGWDGSGVTVAVLDSGVASGHAELAGAVIAEACFCTNNSGGCCPNGSTTQTGAGAAADDHGHGTHVTGIIASRGLTSSPGVAPAASIVAVKVLDSANSFGGMAQIVSGLDWIINNRDDVDVVNMSLGSSTRFAGTCDNAEAWTMSVASAINTLVARGTVITVSSGNEASATTMRVPACVQNAIAVGATYDAAFGTRAWNACTDNTTQPDQIVCFSNAGTALDLLAPGSEIVSLSRFGATVVNRGTSMAAPHVAGAAAVLKEIDDARTPAQIESTLKSTGVSIFDARNGMSFPRINLAAAVDAMVPPCVLTVNQPQSGNVWQAGTEQHIVWEKSTVACGFDVRLELRRAGVFQSNIVASTQNDGSHFWTIPANTTAGTDYTVRIVDNANASVFDDSSVFTISAAPCTLDVAFPTHLTTLIPGRQYNVAWGRTNACGANVQLELWKSGMLHSQIAASAPNNGSFAWTVPNATPSAADYAIRVYDPTTGAAAFSPGGSFTIAGAPVSLLANGSPTQVSLTWGSPGTAGQYRVLRRTEGSGYVVAGTTNNLNFIDTNVITDRAYIYVVQRADSYGNYTDDSVPDLAHTFTFTDATIIAGLTIKRVHVTQPRAVANSLRLAAGLTAFAFTDGVPAIVRLVHVTELQSAIAAARSAAGIPTFHFTAVTGGTKPMAFQLQEFIDSLR